MDDYYVYVYIDPRNYEEYYIGKGSGSRKEAHLNENANSKKSSRTKAIQKEGLKPIIRVVARNLSEHDALLVEATLIWKSRGHLTNISSGHYSEKFRPHDTLHKRLSRFDFQNGLYYYNIGEGIHRNWDDYINYNFISAGQGTLYRKAMLGFEKGDIFVAYLTGKGYVGVGRILQTAKPVREVVMPDGIPLLKKKLICPNIQDNYNDLEKSEYICLVKWIRNVPRNSAKWKRKSGLFTSQLVRASLDSQPKTINYLELEFQLNFSELLE